MSIFSWSIKATYGDFMSLSTNNTPEASPPCLYYQRRTVLPVVYILKNDNSFAIPGLSTNAGRVLAV